MTICSFNQTFLKAAKTITNIIMASSTFYFKQASLTSVDGSHVEWRSQLSQFHSMSISFQGWWVRRSAGPLGTQCLLSLPSLCPELWCLSWNKAAKESKHCKKPLSTISWHHICNVCVSSQLGTFTMSQIETGQLLLEVGTTSLFINKIASAIMGKKQNQCK